jgi:hypothetical protein
MHTAANDSRSASTWRACDDTGLLVMVCRHDHALAFVNIVQSGEKYVLIAMFFLLNEKGLTPFPCRSYFAHALIDWLLNQLNETDSTVGLLYDIGCNLEKGLVRVEHFHSDSILFTIISTTDD